MARYLLVILLALVLGPIPAGSQVQFPKPPDVAEYVSIVPTYAAGTTLNVDGDGSSTAGTPPATELAEIAPVTESGWSTGTGTQCVTGANGGCPEAKFRTRLSGQVRVLYDDPIRNYGRPGTSHCHIFWGNLSTNGYSTYSSLRQHARAKSAAAGGPLNGTGYWSPCVMKLNPFGDGKNYVVKPNDNVIIYYVASTNPATVAKIKKLYLGLRYVGGYDMDDGGSHAGLSNWVQGLIDTANAQPGTANRYRVCQSASNCGVFAHWTCAPTGQSQMTSNVLRNADGSDPFGGLCTAGSDLWVQFKGPSCWDGTNLWSPGGYKHVIPEIWDTVKNNWTCPNGWYRIPDLQFQLHFPQNGFSDYGNWVLSSDIAAGKTSTPGITFHTDWFNGWDKTVLNEWLVNCLGLDGGVQRQCDGSSTSIRQLITSEAAPTGRAPQVQNDPSDTATAGGMLLLPNQSNGPKTLDIHGH